MLINSEILLAFSRRQGYLGLLIGLSGTVAADLGIKFIVGEEEEARLPSERGQSMKGTQK